MTKLGLFYLRKSHAKVFAEERDVCFYSNRTRRAVFQFCTFFVVLPSKLKKGGLS
jgi:hypothetical protein